MPPTGPVRSAEKPGRTVATAVVSDGPGTRRWHVTPLVEDWAVLAAGWVQIRKAGRQADNNR